MEKILKFNELLANWQTADKRLGELASERGFELRHRLVATPEEARAAAFRGSPDDPGRRPRPVCQRRPAVRLLLPRVPDP